MVNMEEYQFDAFMPEDAELFAKITEKGTISLFIYNKNVYCNGKNTQIDPNNYKVRTELRSNISVAPIEVFGLLNDLEIAENTITFNGKTLSFEIGNKEFKTNKTDGMFTVAPFIWLGHVYVPVAETANALGLSAGSYYKNRLTVIGSKEVIDELDAAAKNNPAIEEAGARAVVGQYDAYQFTHEDYVMAKDNWRKFLVGTPETIDMNDEGMRKKVNDRANHARHLMNTMNRDENAVILWGENPPSVTEDIMAQYSRIHAMAMAWGTYGSDLYHNDELKEYIYFGFKWMNEHMYGDAEIEGRGWRDINAFNWWHWYVGGPDVMMEALLVMENAFTREDVCKFMKPVKWFLDNWRLKYCQDQCSGRMSVGTKCALILEDPERLTISSNDYHIMLDIVLTGEGTHTDYCNYQHKFPYNLVYGQSNLHRVLRVASLLAGTPLEFKSYKSYNQYMQFKYMFEAAMYRGRGYICYVGRGGIHSEHGNGMEVSIYLAQMLGNYGPEEDAEIKRFIKYSNAYPEQKQRLKDSCYISNYSTYIDIFNDDSISDANDYECAHAWFTADRATQHRDDYAFVVSMPSYRHVTYECINHENHTGWYMNEGTLYLYTNNDKNAFDGVNFVLNKRLAQRMPGTTVDVRPRPEVSISEGAFSTREKVGCMDFNKKYIVAGMDYECYNREVGEDDYVDTGYGGGNPRFPNDLVAKKAYFMFDDECVCLGAGINSTMNADVLTTVEHRRLVKTENDPIGEDKITVNGKEMSHEAFETVFESPKYARVEGFAGFVFADAQNVSVSKYLYAIDPKEVKDPVSIPEYAQKERPFVEITINHGKNPKNSTYAYAVLPYADDKKLAKYAENPDFEIISNTVECQAVREKNLGITGIVFYEAGECAGIKVDTACIITFEESDGLFKIKVCEPTNKVNTVNVEINKKLELISADNRYEINVSDKTALKLNTALSVGEGYEAVFEM